MQVILTVGFGATMVKSAVLEYLKGGHLPGLSCEVVDISQSYYTHAQGILACRDKLQDSGESERCNNAVITPQ